MDLKKGIIEIELDALEHERRPNLGPKVVRISLLEQNGKQEWKRRHGLFAKVGANTRTLPSPFVAAKNSKCVQI